jgi:hypothetical protein
MMEIKGVNHSLVRFLFISSLFSSRSLFPTGGFSSNSEGGCWRFWNCTGAPAPPSLSAKGSSPSAAGPGCLFFGDLAASLRLAIVRVFVYYYCSIQTMQNL